MVENIIEKWGRIDILVDNGATEFPLPMFFHETDPDLYIEYVNSYMFTRLYMIRAVLDHMKERNSGK